MRNGIILSSTKHADSIDLELEVDPLNVDHFSCTPLVWSSSIFNWTLVTFGNSIAPSLLFLHPFLLCFLVVDVGLCIGSSGGSSGLVQVGPESTGHPRLSRPPASLHRPLPWPHQAGGVSGAAPEGGTAAADPVLLTPHFQHVFLPQPWHPHLQQLDGQLGQRQYGDPQWAEHWYYHLYYNTLHQPEPWWEPLK